MIILEISKQLLLLLIIIVNIKIILILGKVKEKLIRLNISFSDLQILFNNVLTKMIKKIYI